MSRPTTTAIRLLGVYFIFSAPIAGQSIKKTMEGSDYFICSTPQETQVDRARSRRAEQEAEAMEYQTCAPLGLPVRCGSMFPIIAIEDDSWKHPDNKPATAGHPVTVNIAFLDGTPQQRAWVRTYAAEWIEKTKVGLALTFNDAQRNQIRISFARADNRSEIGNQALEVKNPRTPTMYLGDIQAWLSPERRRQIVLHEFGHAFGLRHEHQHPESGIVWNEDAIRSDFPQLSIDAIRADITNTYTRDYLCKGAEKFDSTSIMMYPIPRRWTRNDKSFMPALEISPLDTKCLRFLYSDRNLPFSDGSLLEQLHQ